MTPIRVFLVDDHYVVCEGLHRMLEQEEDICVVGEAESGEEVLARLAKDTADVVLLDARLDGMDGIETLKRLKQLHPDTRVIILTSYSDEFLLTAVEAGADGFFLKRGNRSEIVGGIHTVYEGGKAFDSKVIPSLLYGLQKTQQDSSFNLSSRELEVLELAAGGMSNKEIAEYLEIADQTVKNHITSVLRKLNVNDRTHAVTVALRKGWISNPVPSDWKACT